jgi:hypothetical protein
VIEALRAEVLDLKRRLARNSRNSSRPPSSDGLSKPPPKSLRRPSGRKPGGQEGHQGGHLAKVVVPDEIVDLNIERGTQHIALHQLYLLAAAVGKSPFGSAA